jgi:hypothetical protein
MMARRVKTPRIKTVSYAGIGHEIPLPMEGKIARKIGYSPDSRRICCPSDNKQSTGTRVQLTRLNFPDFHKSEGQLLPAESDFRQEIIARPSSAQHLGQRAGRLPEVGQNQCGIALVVAAAGSQFAHQSERALGCGFHILARDLVRGLLLILA